MFAKLKKKVQEELVSKGNGESVTFASHGPGLASPVRTEASDLQSLEPTDGIEELEYPSSVTSSIEDLVEENGVTEKWSNLLAKKSEKIKKLEAKVSDLAVKIKDKTKLIANLENALEKQHEHMSHKIQELNEQYQASSVKVNDGVPLTMAKKEEDTQQGQQCEDKAQEELRLKISMLEGEVSKLQTEHEIVRMTSGKEIALLIGEQDEWLQKEIDSERRISSLENEVEHLNIELGMKIQDCKHFSSQFDKQDRECEKLQQKLFKLEAELTTKDNTLEQLHSTVKRLQIDYHSCVKEKDDLLVRNAQLSQDLESLKQQSRKEKERVDRELKQRDCSIVDLEQSIFQLKKELMVSQERESELSRTHKTAIGTEESEEIHKLRKVNEELEDQVLDKTKTIKMQQQRLTDLKKTLQRELKVQALPNDDLPEGILASNIGYHTDSSRTKHIKSESRSNTVPPTLIPSASVPMSLNAMSVLRTLEAVTPKHLAGPSPYSANAQLQLNSFQSGTHHFHPSPVSADDDPFQDCRDVNFQYLKHVIMKFLLSQESESLKLIKAVSVLLRFSFDEQKLIKETLEWKMSWFGTKPKLGKGQLAKVIPPPY